MRRRQRVDHTQLSGLVYKRGQSGRFYVDLRQFGGRREALVPPGESYATRDEAVAIALAGPRIRQATEETRSAHLDGRTRIATIGEIAREWLDHRRESRQGNGDVQSVTLDRYERATYHLFKVIDQDLPAHKLTKVEAGRALAALRHQPSRLGGTLSASSARQALTAMQQAYDYAADHGAVRDGSNPWRQLRRTDRPRQPKGHATDFLETYEAHAMLEACDLLRGRENPIRAIFATLILTGGRRDEILGLERADVDLRRDTIEIRPNRWRGIKTGDARTVRIWPQLKSELIRHIRERDIGPGLLFPSVKSRPGRQVMITSIRHPLVELRNLAARSLGSVLGPPLRAKRVTPRALRPTYCAARLQTLDRGHPVAPLTVATELGHSSLSMITRVYGRLGRVRHRSDVVEYLPLDEATRQHLIDQLQGTGAEVTVTDTDAMLGMTE